MSRISFEKKDRQLILCYETESDWLEEKLEEDQDFQIYKTFSFSKKDLISNINQKKLDFELIKNTYKDVVDIITFDELVQRFDRIISFL